MAPHPLRTHTVDIETIGAGGAYARRCNSATSSRSVRRARAPSRPGAARSRRQRLDADRRAGVPRSPQSYRAARGRDADRERESARGGVQPCGEPARHSDRGGGVGILRVLATNVMVAMRTITVERGYDPREFTLVPFGGMGPTIAGLIAADSASAAFSFRATRHLGPRHVVTDVHQQRSLTRITPVDGTTAPPTSTRSLPRWNRTRCRTWCKSKSRASICRRRHAGMRYPRPVLRSGGACAEPAGATRPERSASASTMPINAVTATWRRRKRWRSSISRWRSAASRSPRPRGSILVRGRGRRRRSRSGRPISMRPTPGTVPVWRRPRSRRTESKGRRSIEEQTSTIVPVSGTARACRRLPEHRGRGAILKTSPGGLSEPNPGCARGRNGRE